MLCAKEDSSCSLNVEHLLSVREIIMGQLERRTPTYSWTIFCHLCVMGTRDMTSSFLLYKISRTVTQWVACFQRHPIQPSNIVPNTAEKPQTITEWFSVLRRVCGGFWKPLIKNQHEPFKCWGLWPQEANIWHHHQVL